MTKINNQIQNFFALQNHTDDKILIQNLKKNSLHLTQISIHIDGSILIPTRDPAMENKFIFAET